MIHQFKELRILRFFSVKLTDKIFNVGGILNLILHIKSLKGNKDIRKL